MPILIFGLLGLIVVVAVLRFSNFGIGNKLPRILGMALTGALAVFFAVIERWVPAVFFASICWTIYTGGRALPRDWMDPAAREMSEEPPPPRRDKSTMSRAEALKVLGLGPDADDEAIRAAHRRLILQNHPDKGGSDYLASKVNEAKDVLLGD